MAALPFWPPHAAPFDSPTRVHHHAQRPYGPNAQVVVVNNGATGVMIGSKVKPNAQAAAAVTRLHAWVIMMSRHRRVQYMRPYMNSTTHQKK